jgi:formylglycine-generating enzyme required for sulfatase activity
MSKRSVFVSYSHADIEWLNRLKVFLRPLERDAEFLLWSDTSIQPASNWHADIQTAITDADAAILLISPDFLASDYVASSELPTLLEAASERGLKIFPVIVSRSFLRDSPLLRYQAFNSPSAPLDSLDRPEQNNVLTKLVESIDDLLKVKAAGISEGWLKKFRDMFVPVEGGVLTLGDNVLCNKLHALREREVDLRPFRISKYVITQSEWVAVRNTQPWFNTKNVRYGSDIPAVYLSWYDANDFMRAINRVDSEFLYRLPAEDEWEYAARGGSKIEKHIHTRFCFGDDTNRLMQYGWYDENASSRGESFAHPVGQLSPNQLGLYDMHGNIWEWTADNVDGLGLRSLRGGGFNFSGEGACSAFRVVHKAEVKGEATGFRLVQEKRL